MKKKKNLTGSTLILALLALTTGSSTAQDNFLKDTVFMNAVEISVPQSHRFTPFTVTGIDASATSRYQTDDIGELLRASTALTVKRNGNSGLASVSMRGLSANHTRVTWNGITLAGPATGMADFALIPVCSASDIMISSGGSDIDETSGSPGGRIKLSSAPAIRNGFGSSLVLSAGSYHKNSSLLTLNAGNGKLSSNTNIWGKSALNDFKFNTLSEAVDTDNPGRSNASYNGWGLIQDLFLSSGNSDFSAHIWYNDSDRKLPGSVSDIEYNFHETQADRSLRSVVDFRNTSGKITTTLLAGYSHDENIYTHDIQAYNGENIASVITARAGLSMRVNEKTGLTFTMGNEYQSARALAYDLSENRNLLSASFKGEYMPVSRLKLTLQAREVLSDSDFMSPEVTLGGAFMATSDGSLILKANLSRNISMPCLNDLYWNPGGNPDLRPEESRSGEAGFSLTGTTTGKNSINFDMTLFASSVKDLIQWVPDETGWVWSASNIMGVSVRGLESRLTASLPINHGRIIAGSAYSFTSSVIASTGTEDDPAIGKQLVYTPLHHFSTNISVSYHFLRGGLMIVSDGKRYTDQLNTAALDPYVILDANLGAAFTAGKTSAIIDLSVENILNTDWQSVRDYPMPLRTFTLSARINFSSEKGNK